MKTLFSKKFKRFRRDENGSGIVEMILMIPLLVWCTIATVAFFDAYRARFSTEKATTTIADILSRETNTLDDAYMNGIYDLLTALVYRNEDPGIRVSVLSYDAVADSTDLVWSESRGSAPAALTQSSLNNLAPGLPLMGDLQQIIYVESFGKYRARYEPSLAKAVENFSIYVTASIDPRFAARLCFQDSAGSTLQC